MRCISPLYLKNNYPEMSAILARGSNLVQRLSSRAGASTTSILGSSFLNGASASSAHGRTYATITSRRKKEMRKQAASEQREILAFAAMFDPLRTAKLQLGQTFKLLGWDVYSNETISETLVVDYCLKEWYCAFEVVPGRNYVLPDSENASDDMGFGPGKAVPKEMGGVFPSDNDDGKTIVIPPNQTAFPAAPAPWLSPVRGLVLDKATAERHAAIRARGWKLITIPQPLWEFAASKPKNAHYARRDLLMSLTLPFAPFEARPIELQKLRFKKDIKLASIAAAAAARKALEESDEFITGSNWQSEVAGRLKKAADAARASAEIESVHGKSRKIRRAARVRLEAARIADLEEPEGGKPVA